MSLLEDVFLENEAGEAQELERIIEGDEFDERPRSRSDSDENSAKEDEAEEDKRRVDPTSVKPKRVIKNPRFVLNPARLTGPRGIQVVSEHFKDFKFKGKGHEKEDLDLVLKKLEHWAYRLYPKFKFEDCLKKIETLGKKKAVSVHLHRIRTDQITSDETVVQKDSSDEETPVQAPEEDEFDKLLQQQIEIARATPAPGSIKKTPFSERSSMMPKATASPSINDDQRERMLRNRQLAEARRLARLERNTSQENPNAIQKENNVIKSTQNDASMENNAIDSSDDDDALVINEPITVDVDKHHNDKLTESTKNKFNVADSSDNDVMNSVTKVHVSSDTVELDDDYVVTKSTKCYVPAKRRNKSRTDEDVMNKSVTYDSNNIVELDNVGKVVTKSPKSYLPAKKHNTSKIESSDDDDDLVMNEPIDVDKHHSDSIAKSLRNIANKSNAIDSSDDDNTLVINEPITVDVDKHHNDKLTESSKNKFDVPDSSDDETVTIDDENHHVGAKKHNRIDSSDYEDDAVVTNESITVDIHDSNKHATITSDSNKTDIATDKINTVVQDNDAIEISTTNSSNISMNNGQNTKIIEMSDTEVENVSETNITDKIEVRNEQNDLEMDNVNEFMDVDFTDDF